jgi:subtilase family serine protease
VSARFPVPGYQANAKFPNRVGTGTAGRGIPDMSGNASVNSGYPIAMGGQSPGPTGGTSAVAPLYAGLIALINANLGYSVGFINPILYSLASSAFHDISWQERLLPAMSYTHDASNRRAAFLSIDNKKSIRRSERRGISKIAMEMSRRSVRRFLRI